MMKSVSCEPKYDENRKVFKTIETRLIHSLELPHCMKLLFLREERIAKTKFHEWFCPKLAAFNSYNKLDFTRFATFDFCNF